MSALRLESTLLLLRSISLFKIRPVIIVLSLGKFSMTKYSVAQVCRSISLSSVSGKRECITKPKLT